MIIREAQFEALQNALTAKVEMEFVEQCYKFSPPLCKAAGDRGVLQTVRNGMERAQSYSFSDKDHIQFYIEMMLVLGSEFDSDPQFPWAAEILQDFSSQSHVRVLALHRDLSLYLDRVVGPENVFLKEALANFLELRTQLSSPEELNIDNVRKLLWRFFPQKYDDMNDDQLSQIEASAMSRAREFELTWGDGLIAGIMFMFGHGATSDNLYPWIANTLAAPPTGAEDTRLQRLWAKLHLYAEHAGKYLGQPI